MYTLREIINILGNKNYPIITVRGYINIDNEVRDVLYGYCKYENGELESLDDDIYSLDDEYSRWEEWGDSSDNFLKKGDVGLAVWENEKEDVMTQEQAVVEVIFSGKYDDLTIQEAREKVEELVKNK